LRFKESIVKCR